MAFASDADDRTANQPSHGNDDQGTVFGFSFTLAKTTTAAFRGAYTATFQGRPPRTDVASHTGPGRGRGPLPGAPPAPAER